MIIHSSFTILLTFSLFIHTLYGINPAYFREHHPQQQLASLIETINEQQSNPISSEINQDNVVVDDDNDDDDDQLIKRNKYPNFRVSPLWLSRRTRTNRFYGKPLWISRPG